VEPLLCRCIAHLTDLSAATRARAAEPGVSAADAVWLDEQEGSQRNSLEMLTRMRALLRAVSAGGGGAHAYIGACGMLMEFMVSHMLSLITCFGTRRAWMAQLGGMAVAPMMTWRVGTTRHASRCCWCASCPRRRRRRCATPPRRRADDAGGGRAMTTDDG
jgi:hypothetical protein